MLKLSSPLCGAKCQITVNGTSSYGEQSGLLHAQGHPKMANGGRFLAGEMDIAADAGRSAVGTTYPRRRAMRFVLRSLAGIAFTLLGRVRIEGRDNLPANGPFLLVANHFHFADPVALLWMSRRQVEFIGGFRFVFAPRIVRFLPHLWGYFPAYRGGYSRQTLRSAQEVLAQDGVVALFPEGGIWAQVLRPPRPGAAFLALETGVPVVPVGLDGFTGLFKSWRPELVIRIGPPVGPFLRDGAGADRRVQTDRVGEEIMRSIAGLIPEERHGVYSDDPARQAAAWAVSAFPFEREELRGN
jgi:1-acyl-sn-glycerol-3-phosphate acyltransferase